MRIVLPDKALYAGPAIVDHPIVGCPEARRLAGMSENTYLVTGMSCGHCAQSVTEELTEVPGVENVTVDVETGHVTVRSAEALDETAVRAAVEEAGYTYEGLASLV